MSHSFYKFNISTLQIISNLIFTVLQLNHCMIRILVYIFVNIFDDLYKDTHLYIDMSFVSTTQIQIVQNYSMIVKVKLLIHIVLIKSNKCSVIVSSVIQ